MKNISKKFYFPLCTAITIASISGCYMNSPEPLETHLHGPWKWDYTYEHGKPIEQPSPGLNKFLRVADLDLGAKYDQVFRFYTNDVQTDSLFRQITNNSETPSTADKKNKIVYASVVDGNGEPGIVRIKFFFPTKKRSPNRIRINIQSNTISYNLAADTLEMEYSRY